MKLLCNYCEILMMTMIVNCDNDYVDDCEDGDYNVIMIVIVFLHTQTSR
jgi:hypothetical protein